MPELCPPSDSICRLCKELPGKMQDESQPLKQFTGEVRKVLAVLRVLGHGHSQIGTPCFPDVGPGVAAGHVTSKPGARLRVLVERKSSGG